jgi:hypothetical protein
MASIMKRTSPWQPILVALCLPVISAAILLAPRAASAKPAASDPPTDPKSAPQAESQSAAQTPPSPPATTEPAPEPRPAAEPGGKDAPAPAAGADKLSPYQGKGFRVASLEGGKYSLTLSGRIQIGTVFLAGTNQDTQFWPDLYSARLIFQGNVVNRDIFYGLQLGFGDVERYFSPNPLLDLWIDFRKIPEAHVRIGTLDRHANRHSSASNILTMDSIVHYELDLYRDVGIRIYSDKPFGTDKLKYTFDLSSGKGVNYLVEPTVLNLLYYGRLEVSPLGQFDNTQLGDLKRREHPAISLAVQGAYNQNAIYPLSDWTVPGQVPFQKPFNYVHASTDLTFKWRGFSLLGTAVYRRATKLSHDVPGTGGQNITEYSRNGWGWFAVAGMMLTDHLQIASRVSALYQIDRPAGLVATAPYLAEGFTQPELADFRDLREVAAGLSYYIVGHAFKVQADYCRIFIGNFDAGVHEVRTLLSLQL